jgi:hypothetical protein
MRLDYGFKVQVGVSGALGGSPYGATTIADVIAIQRFFLVLPTGIANVGKYQFNPSTRTYLGVGTDQIGQNYDTLILGDVATPFVE